MSKSLDGVTLRSLLGKIRTSFKSFDFDIVLKTRRMVSLSENEFYVNAYYDQEADKHNEIAIEVHILHNINSTNTFEFSQLSQFVVQVYDAVVHELRHRHQSHQRRYKLNPHVVDYNCSYSYLSDPDEIDAYSLSIAIELIRNLGKERAMAYLHRASRLAKIRPKGLFASPTLFAYFDEFGGTTDPVIRKLVKKVYLNLEQLDKSAIFY